MWALENHERKKGEKAAAEALAEQRALDRRNKEKAEKRHQYEHADDGKLQEDINETQKVLAMGRANGTLKGVNAKTHQVVPIPVKETDRKLFIRIRDDVDFSWKPKHMRPKESLQPFNVDLRLYSEVEHLVGVNIGERGVLALSAEFLRGSCSNITVLDLSR